MQQLPPLYALRAFEMAARFGSFTKAADALNVTPGAISRHIKTLEEWFGCPLFIRHGPKIEPSSQGLLLAQQLKLGFDQLEKACLTIKPTNTDLRLKAPSTLSIRWLLGALKHFNETELAFGIQMSSVWMENDHVDFNNEPYDCAILSGNGQFGGKSQCAELFPEYLIPVCAPTLVHQAQNALEKCHLLHPTKDRRDWKRWTQAVMPNSPLNIQAGTILDTLEQGNMAAMGGHGVSISDMRLVLPMVENSLLALPYSQAISTGDSYYLVWPPETDKKRIEILLAFLKDNLPAEIPSGIEIVELVKTA